MAGPWDAYQDAASAQLTQNDAAVVAPPRATVPSSARVVGDEEGQRLGLYDSPKGPWDAFKPQAQSDRAPVQITINPVASRFGELQQPANSEALQSGLEQRTLEMTRGPELQPAAQMAGEMNNLVSAASQGTSPHVSNYGGRIVSTETFEDDGGNLLYRDPQTKKIVPTDNSKHIALRDPADGVIKVFSRTEATNENPVVGVSRVLAPGLGAGAVTKRAAIAATEKVVPRASEIFSTAKPYYRAFTKEAQGIDVPQQTAKDLSGRIKGALDKANLIPELAPPVYSAVGILEKGEPLTLDALQNIKRVVGRSFASPDKNVRDAAAVASKEINKIIGEVSESAGQNLKTGDAIHSTARSVQELQRKADISQLRTGRAGYGGNAVNSMRQVLSPIVQKSIEGRVTGFQPGEIAAMREIVEGTTATNALRQAGAMAPSKGIMQIALGGATAGATAAVGSVANKLATILTGKQIERLNQLVAKRSPAYEQAVAKAVARFEKTQIEFANNPTPNKMAAYVSASRGLSSGLTKDGIQITSGDLIRAIAGPPKAAADAEQDQAPPIPGQ